MKNVPSYIQKSFKDTIRDHFKAVHGQSALSKSDFKEVQDRSLQALTALEASDTREERDTIYEDILTEPDKFSKVVYNLVAATDHQMQAKEVSEYGRKMKPAPTNTSEVSLDMA